MKLNQQQLATTIKNQIAEQPFSGAILIREDDTVVYEGAFGFAHRAEQLPNTLLTRFGTASGCKVFTATAVLQLVEQGKFTLETPLKDVLETPYTINPAITVGHLLTHSSGLYDYCDEELMSDEDCFAFLNSHPVYILLEPGDYPLDLDRPLKFKPGERFNYNNGAFVALAWLVAQQSGLGFHDYVKTHIFQPAGMTDSGYFRMDALPAGTAYGYLPQEDGSYRTNFFALPTIGSGDGGAYVTAPDWVKFWDALYGHKLLSPAMTESMIRPHIATGHETIDRWYGLGVWITQRDGAIYERYVVGEDFGVGMVSVLFPQYNVLMTILDNVGDGVWGLWGALVKHFDAVFGAGS